MLKILIVASLYGVFMLPEPSSSETCVGEFGLTYACITDKKNFDDATSWCQMNNSTLAAINDTGIQMAVTRLITGIDSQMFINMKLNQRSGNTWLLVNGSKYLGNVENQDYLAYKLYSYLKPHKNGTINEFLVEASEPSILRYNLCEFEGTRCLSNSTNNFLFNNRCYVKYDNENLTWYKARERCIDSGGDIAQFQNGSNPWIPPFNTDWMNPSLSYWAGIRWNGWSWKYSGDTNEIIYTSWSDGEPNTVNYECVCVDAKGNPPWSWSDCDCATPRPFVCIKIIPTTTVSTTTSTTTASPTAIPTIAATLNSAHALPNKSEGLIVGLVLGLAVNLPLTITTVFLIVWNVRLRRRLRETDKNDERKSTTAKPVERSAARTNATDPDINYQHLKRETMFGPGTSMPTYDQLSQPENRDYELTS